VSYDIYLRGVPCPTCQRSDEGPSLPDPTYNLTPIFDRALTGEPLPNAQTSEFAVVILRQATDRPRGLRLLNGRKAADTITLLEQALRCLRDPANRAELVALEPDNGWGDLAGATDVIATLVAAAQEHPDHVWEVR
jgi:hypothetical protein